MQLTLPNSAESDLHLRIRHSCAHVMAMAVQRLYPEAKVTLGPWTEQGFYYDFDWGYAPTAKDLTRIKNEMRKIIKKDMPFVREEVGPEEARRRIQAMHEPYKEQILDSILARDPTEPITIYHIGEPGSKGHWWDLCAGPHVASTGAINPKAFDLERTTTCFWRGDSSNPVLVRVYGTAWASPEELEYYCHVQAEVAKRDHRRLGTELELFSISEHLGQGLVLWHPRGALVRGEIESFWREEHQRRGYQIVYTPHVAKLGLWKTSGHCDFYSDSMFAPMAVDEEAFQLRPMNCPFHIQMFNSRPRAYSELPLRWAELGTVYRYEDPTQLSGLFRVRGFTQDDAHIFCLPSQVRDEIRGVLNLIRDVLTAFGFAQYEVDLSTRPAKAVGANELWDEAETALREALDDVGWDYVEDVGGGAFYGPKIDIKIKDALGRRWQCSTVQLDFNLPERFNMRYMAASQELERPIMIHRALLGSIERFFGILIENYAGAFPLWLAPVQVRLLPVFAKDYLLEHCQQVVDQMRALGIRAEVATEDRFKKMVRVSEQSKIPVMCCVGEKEVENGLLAVRTYLDGDLGPCDKDAVIQNILHAIKMKQNYKQD